MSTYSKDFLEHLYRSMLRIRLCEESLIAPILDGTIKTPCHLYSGQEAIAAGMSAALRQSDYVFGNHRSHGHYLAKGGDMKAMLSEIYCRDNGCSRGRGGSMHLIAPEDGVMGIVPIVSGTISLAMGAALAIKTRKSTDVCVSFFGDGATGEGVLYETLNFASLKKLPLIFACENNLYSTHLPIQEIRTNKNIQAVAQPFGISSFCVDGNQVMNVYETAEKAAELCRNGQGPVFIEFLTYRFRGHVGSNDNIQGTQTDIRPPVEVEEWLKKDPLILFRNYLYENKLSDEGCLQLIDKEVEEEVRQANEYALNSPKPDKESLLNYVFK